MTDFTPCPGCQMKSACKTGHACTINLNIKRREREAKLLECAARELCRVRGIEPDELIMRRAGPGEVIAQSAYVAAVPKWKHVADEITRHNQIADAIAHALRATQ